LRLFLKNSRKKAKFIPESSTFDFDVNEADIEVHYGTYPARKFVDSGVSWFERLTTA
jgi:hypothetical protein